MPSPPADPPPFVSAGSCPAPQVVAEPSLAEARQALRSRPTALGKPKGCVSFWCAVGQHEITPNDRHKRKDVKPVFKGADGVFKVYTKDNTWAVHSSGISSAAQRGVEIAEDDLWCCSKCYQSPHHTEFGRRRSTHWNAVRDGAAVSVGAGSAPCTRQELRFHKRLAEDALHANEHLEKKNQACGRGFGLR